jgi:RNA polymerase sigma-70 factor (ECF subfamily)
MRRQAAPRLEEGSEVRKRTGGESGASMQAIASATGRVEASVALPTGLDEGAIRAFVIEDYPRIVTGLSVMCGSRAAAEDAVQEALARAWERSERGEQIDGLAGWVTVAARNILRSWFRRVRAERRARGALAQRGDLSESSGMTEVRLDVVRALRTLTKTQRETTVLYYYLGMKVGEIGRTLGVSEGTVKSTLYRARQILGPALGINDSTEGVTHDARP